MNKYFVGHQQHHTSNQNKSWTLNTGCNFLMKRAEKKLLLDCLSKQLNTTAVQGHCWLRLVWLASASFLLHIITWIQASHSQECVLVCLAVVLDDCMQALILFVTDRQYRMDWLRVNLAGIVYYFDSSSPIIDCKICLRSAGLQVSWSASFWVGFVKE